MEKTNNKLTYSEEDLKILKKSIESVKRLNCNQNNKNKSNKKRKNTLNKKVA